MSPRRTKGFTLLEMMLVLLLAGVVLGMAGLQLGRDPQRLASQEAGFLLQLVEHARQQAVLEGQEMGVQFDARGYQLMKASGTSWVAAGQRRDTGLDLRLSIDGFPVTLAGPGNTAQLVFSRNDEHTPFSLSFHEGGVDLAQLSSDGLNAPWLER
ncbi:type II secretion system minor pseudopilin GspH [Pseudomonas sp. NBRC 111124]|uniref:type II secretion system minor pseudopilin GspH n=1 Tax=Pseudomonas sp. NBRC 111124 TaxID=1661039 RepID=UPI000761B59D|nr:type II secretion system minor pseudopilin GspH [Pseudomonas sp. NBRC 111124]